MNLGEGSSVGTGFAVESDRERILEGVLVISRATTAEIPLSSHLCRGSNLVHSMLSANMFSIPLRGRVESMLSIQRTSVLEDGLRGGPE